MICVMCMCDILMCNYNGSRTFARGDTRPYWTLGRKDSRALDTRPVGHLGVHRVDTRANSRSMWSYRDALIKPVFIQLISLQYSWVIGPSCLKISSSLHDLTTGTGIALCYVQLFIPGGFSVTSSYSVFSPRRDVFAV